MSSAVKRKLIVCGGNGFLGSRICRSAASRGWAVTSISRSGEPKWASVSSSPTAPAWSKDITWHAASVLEPTAYTDLLSGADAVVHPMDILLESDYKGVVQGRESLFSMITRSFGSAGPGAGNPLEQKSGEAIDPNGKITYELMNRDSSILLARETQAAKVPTFVYISASSAPPIVPGRYMATKRAAESTISKAFPDLRSIFMRPGFMYDSSRSFTMPLAAATSLGAAVNSAVGGRLTPLMGAGGEKPLKADDVAEAVVEAVEDSSIKGVVAVQAIESLANKAWRKGMA